MPLESGNASPFPRLQTRLASRFNLGLFLIFLLALTLRLIYLNQMDRGIYFNILKMEGADSFIFWKWALEVLEKNFLGQGVYHQSPLYPYFLAAIFKLFSANREEVEAEADRALALHPPPWIKLSLENLSRQMSGHGMPCPDICIQLRKC